MAYLKHYPNICSEVLRITTKDLRLADLWDKIRTLILTNISGIIDHSGVKFILKQFSHKTAVEILFKQ